MNVLADLRADLKRDGCTWRSAIPRVLLAPRCQALVLMRLSFIGPMALRLVWRRLNYTLNGCDISPDCRIGEGLELPHPLGVVIGPEVVVGRRCTIRQHATLGRGGSGDPTIGDDVIVGIGAIVFGGVKVGDGAQIAAYALVRDDVPAGMLAIGSPAVVKGVNRQDPRSAGRPSTPFGSASPSGMPPN